MLAMLHSVKSLRPGSAVEHTFACFAQSAGCATVVSAELPGKALKTASCSDSSASELSEKGFCSKHQSWRAWAQIRRYVYCDVVRTQDIQRYLDPAGVQTYIINQAKVVFLNHRPQSKLTKVRLLCCL